jgi:hypothetical protein
MAPSLPLAVLRVPLLLVPARPEPALELVPFVVPLLSALPRASLKTLSMHAAFPMQLWWGTSSSAAKSSGAAELACGALVPNGDPWVDAGANCGVAAKIRPASVDPANAGVKAKAAHSEATAMAQRRTHKP